MAAWPRLTFVTGKGGTGKSTLALALARALAKRRATVLATLDGASGAMDASFKTQEIGDGLRAIALEARAELQSFVETIVPLQALSRRMLGSRTFSYVTAAVPGLESFLMLERLRGLAGEAAQDDGYVVVDGLSTGASREMLKVVASIKSLAPRGTLNRFAGSHETFLADRNLFGLLLVAQPEDLSISETLQAAEDLQRLTPPVACRAVLLNGVVNSMFTPHEVAAAADLSPQGRALVQRRVARAQAAKTARARLRTGGLQVVDVPMFFAPTLESQQLESLGTLLQQGLGFS